MPRSCLDALRAAKALPYDIILVDLHMLEMDGIETTKRISAGATACRNVPIIAVTTDAMSGDHERFIAAGMSGHVVKPINRAVLMAAIEQHTPQTTPLPNTTHKMPFCPKTPSGE
ncbi:MAG: response regulator [Acetobacteraceae bacterium]|nr:response regulator [Acetobacteraceae bacterium]